MKKLHIKFIKKLASHSNFLEYYASFIFLTTLHKVGILKL